MKSVFLVLTSLFSLSAFAGGFDIDNPKILGHYELISATPEAEIESIKIIINHDNQLVLVRDEDYEYVLHPADRNGVVFQDSDDPNPGSGDEPNCYYDANFVVRLGATQNARGHLVPQITIDVDRVDAYENDPDYNYQVIFNWASEIEDAVPFYFNMEEPAELQATMDSCHTVTQQVFGHSYENRNVCSSVYSYKIREGISAGKAFASLIQEWPVGSVLDKAALQDVVFTPNDLYLKKLAVKKDKPEHQDSLLAAAHVVQSYIREHAQAVAFSDKSSYTFYLYILDAKNGTMHQFVFTR